MEQSFIEEIKILANQSRRALVDDFLNDCKDKIREAASLGEFAVSIRINDTYILNNDAIIALNKMGFDAFENNKGNLTVSWEGVEKPNRINK
jgi:hypothetical protein